MFLSRYVSSIDKKGRVSIPASYRNVLSKDNNNVILYPSLKNKCIEACSVNRMEKVVDMIEALDPFSKEQDAFYGAIVSQSVMLNIDASGRIIIPKLMLDAIDVESQMLFVGKGRVFEIWSVNLFNNYIEGCKKIALDNLNLLRH